MAPVAEGSAPGAGALLGALDGALDATADVEGAGEAGRLERLGRRGLGGALAVAEGGALTVAEGERAVLGALVGGGVFGFSVGGGAVAEGSCGGVAPIVF